MAAYLVVTRVASIIILINNAVVLTNTQVRRTRDVRTASMAMTESHFFVRRIRWPVLPGR